MGKNIGNNQSGLMLLLFLLVFLVAAAGEDSAGREVKLFNRGYESYLSYQPEKAVEEFTSFLKEFPDSSARDAALFWLGKSYMQMKSFGEARRVFMEIKQNYPESPYLSHAESELTSISRLEVDAHMVTASEPEAKNESPEKRLKEAEKKGKALDKSLKETAEERDRLRAQLKEEEKRTASLLEQVKQLEKKEKTLQEVAGERDELRRKRDEEKKTIKELETKVEICENDIRKMRSGGKELAETQQEKDSLRKLLDDERKTTADLTAKIKEFEKKEKTIKDLAEDCRGKTDALQLRIKELEEKEKKTPSLDQSLAGITQERDTLSKMLGEERKKAEDLLIRIKELEKTEEVIAQMSQEKEQLIRQIDEGKRKQEELEGKIKQTHDTEEKPSKAEQDVPLLISEKDALSRNLGEEKQKTALLLARIKELEAKENLVADIIYERDTLKVQVEEQQRMIHDFQNRPGTTGGEEKPLAVTLPVHEEVKQPEEEKKEEEQKEPRREKEQDETESSGDPVPVVLRQLGIQEVPWRSGNSKEDEEAEKVLYEEARSLKITGDEKTLKDLAAKHGFNAKQQEYLKRYLAVSEYIDRRLKSMPDEEVIELLEVTYEEANRYTKIVLATELQENARRGEPFEEIYKLYPDMMVYRVIPSQQLEKQTRDKISGLAHGEIGVIWSENGYMILKPLLKKLSYEPFHNLSPGIKDRIRTLVNAWVQELKLP